ncbi:MAG: hypothetical protein ACI4Q9_02265 [Candidatus Methanomethylophilaceae archaeon]
MNSTQLIAISVAAIVVVAVGAVVIINTDNNPKGADDVMDMTWDEILSDARGQTITMGFYTADPAVSKWFPEFVERMSEQYGITVTANSYGPAAAKTAVGEMENGQMTDGTFDLIWGDTSAYAAMKNSQGDFSYVWDDLGTDGKSWVYKLPNSYYLRDNCEQMISGMFGDYVSGSAANFSNGQTMLVYNKDFNVMTETINGVTVDVPYNCVILYDGGVATGFIKVSPSTSGTSDDYTSGKETSVTGIDSVAGFNAAFEAAVAYDIDSVRDVIKASNESSVKGVLKYGIADNFSDLVEWVKIYPGQFGYPAPTNSAAVFHTNLLAQAVVYELTWADGSAKTGWKVAEDKAANIASVNAALADVDSDEDYYAAFGYVFEYLKELDGYVHVWSDSSKYQNTDSIVAYNNLILGNNATDKDFSDKTIMIAMSTVTSIDARVGTGLQYDYNAGVYSMDTGCSSDYYIFIPQNSSHKTAAMVVINALLSPEEQIKWYAETGNGFNIDTSKTVIGGTETVNEAYFEDVLKDMSMYLSPERLSEVTVVAQLTGYVTYFTSNWVEQEAAW